MNTSLKLFSCLAVATAVSLFSMPSGAADSTDGVGRSKAVKVWDLDLAKDADVQTLYTRVRDAAADVCGMEARRYRAATRRPAPIGWSERCVAQAVDAAVRDVGNRRLATLNTEGTRAQF
jgi:UrcA family protein